jgi:hypothetical protein
MVSTIDSPQGPYRADHPAMEAAAIATSTNAPSSDGDPLSTAC